MFDTCFFSSLTSIKCAPSERELDRFQLRGETVFFVFTVLIAMAFVLVMALLFVLNNVHAQQADPAQTADKLSTISASQQLYHRAPAFTAMPASRFYASSHLITL